MSLRQTYEREGASLSRQAGRYAHARQFKRMRSAIKRQRTILGRLIRDIERKLSTVSEAGQAADGAAQGVPDAADDVVDAHRARRLALRGDGKDDAGHRGREP